ERNPSTVSESCPFAIDCSTVTPSLERDEFRLSISRVFEVVGTFVWHKGCERLPDCGPDGLDGSCGGFAQEVLELGEDLLDRVQIGRIFRQKEELCANRADECSHDFTFV